jgi:hypothetical protein
MTAHQRKLSVMKFLLAEGAMDQEEVDKMLSSDVGAGVVVKAGFDLDKAVKVFQAGQNPQIYLEQNQVRGNAREVVGMSRNQLGEFDDSTRRTATEASIVDQSSRARSSRRMIKVRDAYVKVMRMVGRMVGKLWKVPQIVDVVGEDGMVEWVSFTGKALEGEFGMDIQFSANPPLSPAQRAQRALGLMGFFAQDPLVDQGALRRFLMDQMNAPVVEELYRARLGGQDAALQLPMQAMRGAAGRVQAGGGSGGGQVQRVRTGQAPAPGQ